MGEQKKPNWRGWIVVAMLFAATAVGAVWIIRLAPEHDGWRAEFRENPYVRGAHTSQFDGVGIRIVAGDIEIERSFLSPNFILRAGESLDARVPPGPFVATIQISLDTGFTSQAQFGVMVTGGSASLKLNGREILPAQADHEQGVYWSELQSLRSGAVTTLECRFERVDERECSIRIVWKPEGAENGHAIRVASTRAMFDRAAEGQRLVRSFRCVSCHAAGESALGTFVPPLPAPNLDRAGETLRAEWMIDWLTDPNAVMPDSGMLHTTGGLSTPETVAEDIVHYLESISGPKLIDTRPVHPQLADHGLVLFYQVGCFACHGDLQSVVDGAGARFSPIPPQSTKRSLRSLAEYLRQPSKDRAAATMPSLSLSQLEADALAVFLISRDDLPSTSASAFEVQDDRAMRGKQAFQVQSCNACHTAGTDFSTITPPAGVPTFEEILRTPDRGCLSDDAHTSGVTFAMSGRQRRAISAFLSQMREQRAMSVPIDTFTATIDRFGCMNCHTMYGRGGPAMEIDGFLRSTDPKDMTDEGRLPPDLTDAGARLRSSWIKEVLMNHDTRIRPYMHVRMPDYAFNEEEAEMIADGFQRLAGVASATDDPPIEIPPDADQIGRDLVGVGWLNCIECHRIGDNPSTGLPGIDLTNVRDRFTFAAFKKLVEEPNLERPGTRMSRFFAGGQSAAIGAYGGDASQQIAAIWEYLDHADELPPPDGYPGARKVIMEVGDSMTVVRGFLAGGAERAIACGWPGGVNIGYSIDNAQLEVVWNGPLLAEGGPITTYGDSSIPTSRSLWRRAPGPLFIVADEPPVGWQLSDGSEPRFVEVITADDETISFRTRFGAAGTDTVEVEERISVQTKQIRRRFIVDAHGSSPAIWFHLESAARITDHSWPGQIVHRDDGLIRIGLNEQGIGQFTVEIPISSASSHE